MSSSGVEVADDDATSDSSECDRFNLRPPAMKELKPFFFAGVLRLSPAALNESSRLSLLVTVGSLKESLRIRLRIFLRGGGDSVLCCEADQA
mgnify:CR=1 FL=1